MFCCLDVQLYHLLSKRRFVCAHIGQKRHIYPPGIFRLHFWLVPPPPFAQVHRGGCYREKFFYFFRVVQLDSSSSIFLMSFVFCLSNIINYRFDSHASFTQYLLVCDSRIRLWILTRINFDLFQHCRLYALTLRLFISSACYKQTSMLMQSLFYAYFGYFKAFWRVFVCFRCSLSSLVKIMRQKA